MRFTMIGLASLIFAAGLFAAQPKNLFVFADEGVSIEPPPLSGDAPVVQLAMFFLPPANSFTANVGIQKQQFAGTIGAYDTLSANQFKQMGLTILTRKLKGNEILWEYKGTMQEKLMHWYARSIKANNYVFVVTAVGLEEQWGKQKTALMKSVDSFVLKK